MRHRPGRGRALILPAAAAVLAPVLMGAATAREVSVTVTGLRNARGQVMACLTAQPAAFPDCKRDARARHKIVPAGTGPVSLDFGLVPAGSYAVSLFHDENSNGKLDVMVMVPKEGFGFSRDAKVRFGPPRFAAAAFVVGEAPVHETIRMRYMF